MSYCKQFFCGALTAKLPLAFLDICTKTELTQIIGHTYTNVNKIRSNLFQNRSIEEFQKTVKKQAFHKKM
jgi:hypothetical protein